MRSNGSPDITPADLLGEEVTKDDLVKLEQVMGRFSCTTSFLCALKTVLESLEAEPEVRALETFLPIMAQVESDAMNAPGPDEQPSPVNCSDGVGGDGVQE